LPLALALALALHERVSCVQGKRTQTNIIKPHCLGYAQEKEAAFLSKI